MFTLLCAISIQILKFFCKDRRLLLYMSRTLHLFGTDWCAMMVPIQVIRWYRMQCYDGTDSCATVVPIRRYCHFPACRKDYHAIFHLVLMLEGGYYAHYIMKVFVCNCYSNANENLSKLHFQCCLFLKIFLRQQEHHIIINDNPQIARDGIIISFIVVKVFTLMKRV